MIRGVDSIPPRHVYQPVGYRAANLRILYPVIPDLSVDQRSANRR